jgi:hypothetical protein
MEYRRSSSKDGIMRSYQVSKKLGACHFELEEKFELIGNVDSSRSVENELEASESTFAAFSKQSHRDDYRPNVQGEELFEADTGASDDRMSEFYQVPFMLPVKTFSSLKLIARVRYAG